MNNDQFNLPPDPSSSLDLLPWNIVDAQGNVTPTPAPFYSTNGGRPFWRVSDPIDAKNRTEGWGGAARSAVMDYGLRKGIAVQCVLREGELTPAQLVEQDRLITAEDLRDCAREYSQTFDKEEDPQQRGVYYLLEQENLEAAERIVKRPVRFRVDHQAPYTLWYTMLGVKRLCTKCRGVGRIMYGNTSTWRGGIGGQAMTEGVCNKCWGSCDEERPHTNLLALEQQWRDRVNEVTIEMLRKRLGAEYACLRDGAIEVAAELERLAQPSKRARGKQGIMKPVGYFDVCKLISSLLREGVAATDARQSAGQKTDADRNTEPSA